MASASLPDTAATFPTVDVAIVVNLGPNPLLFLIPAALAANCSSFMLLFGP